ncbi:MAG TPA: GNAT family N-acetyltransferase [Pyrinomonadaceae bacterium]|nr:GNAT family N-acetyltransferase [Pyrinomonadaceae bacterium]
MISTAFTTNSARHAGTRSFVESLRGALAGEPCRLRSGQEREVQAFLAARPLHTVYMAGLVADHGLESEACRGTFYGCRGAGGRLEGVAIVGHHTLFEASTPEALRRLALLARAHSRETHLILGERRLAAEFWRHYSGGTLATRRVLSALLYELREAPSDDAAVKDKDSAALRAPQPATPDLLDPVARAHAEMAQAESGINPLERDPEGFRRRCLRRIEAGRTHVLVRDGRLLFKAEVIAETPGATYLEGVYVAPEVRGLGVGAGCLARLSADLLRRTQAVCLLVNEENGAARALYRRAGFSVGGHYASIFL